MLKKKEVHIVLSGSQKIPLATLIHMEDLPRRSEESARPGLPRSLFCPHPVPTIGLSFCSHPGGMNKEVLFFPSVWDQWAADGRHWTKPVRT